MKNSCTDTTHTPGPWDWDCGVIPPDGPGRYADIYIDSGDTIIAHLCVECPKCHVHFMTPELAARLSVRSEMGEREAELRRALQTIHDLPESLTCHSVRQYAAGALNRTTPSAIEPIDRNAILRECAKICDDMDDRGEYGQAAADCKRAIEARIK